MNATSVVALSATTTKDFLEGGSVFVTPLSLFLLQALIIVVLSRVIAFPLSYISEPRVVAEMLAGILLGSSVFGRIPGFTTTIFTADSVKALAAVAQYGLVLFMFVIGLEQDMSLWRNSARRTFVVALVGVVVPVVFVMPFAFASDSPDYHSTTSFGLYMMFVGVLCSIAALPVLARIIAEFNFLQTPLGMLTMSASTIEDLVAWPLLALLVALSASSSALTLLWIVLLCVGEAILVFGVLRPLLRFAVERLSHGHEFSESAAAIVLLVLLGVSFVSEVIGVTAIVGAYLVGCIVPRHGHFCEHLVQRFGFVLTTAFLPLYFAVSGIRTQLGLLDSGEVWGLTILLIVCGCVGKIGGCLIGARYVVKLSWLNSAIFGILMNTKGLVALVTANVGLSGGLITQRMFSMCIVMVLFHTMMTGPLMSLIYRLVMKKSFLAENTKAKLGSEINVVVAVDESTAAAEQTVRASAILYGKTQRRAALHLWKLSQAEANSRVVPRRFPFLGAHSAATTKTTAAAATAARDLGVKVTVRRSHVIATTTASTMPRELARVVRESNAAALVVSAPDVRALESAPIRELCRHAPCDVVVVVASSRQRDAGESPVAASSSSLPSSGDNETLPTPIAAPAAAAAGRIVVAYVGGDNDDLALDVAVGCASQSHPVLIIKSVSDYNQHRTTSMRSADDDDDDDEGSSSIALEPDLQPPSTATSAQIANENRFLQRAMANVDVDVLWRANVEAVVDRVVYELAESPVRPALLVVGRGSPIVDALVNRARLVDIANRKFAAHDDNASSSPPFWWCVPIAVLAASASHVAAALPNDDEAALSSLGIVRSSSNDENDNDEDIHKLYDVGDLEPQQHDEVLSSPATLEQQQPRRQRRQRRRRMLSPTNTTTTA